VGRCVGPAGGHDNVNSRYKDHVNTQDACQALCSAEPNCVGYAFHDPSDPDAGYGGCYVYGPGVDHGPGIGYQGDGDEWDGNSYSTTTIGGSDGSSYICVTRA
jgi:hypothetical protein